MNVKRIILLFVKCACYFYIVFDHVHLQKYLHVLSLNFILQLVLWKILDLHDDGQTYLRPVVQCHTLVELLWLLEASLDVMLNINPVLHFVPPFFILHYAKFSLERTYNISYILNQQIAKVTDAFYLILMKYQSHNKRIYSVFQNVKDSSLYSSNVRKLKQSDLERYMGETHIFLAGQFSYERIAKL